MLKNIQVLMDASVALMNQYTMIATQFPLPTNPTPTTSVGTSTVPTTITPTPAESTTTVEAAKPSEEKKVSDSVDSGAGPSTSKAAISIESNVQLDSNVTIEDIGRNDPSEPDESISEVRRRRLQKFEAKGVDS